LQISPPNSSPNSRLAGTTPPLAAADSLAHRPPAPLFGMPPRYPSPPWTHSTLAGLLSPPPRRAAAAAPVLHLRRTRAPPDLPPWTTLPHPRVAHGVPQLLHRLLLACQACATLPRTSLCTPPRWPPWRNHTSADFASPASLSPPQAFPRAHPCHRWPIKGQAEQLRRHTPLPPPSSLQRTTAAADPPL